jgi:hypothetical protein
MYGNEHFRLSLSRGDDGSIAKRYSVTVITLHTFWRYRIQL